MSAGLSTARSTIKVRKPVKKACISAEAVADSLRVMRTRIETLGYTLTVGSPAALSTDSGESASSVVDTIDDDSSDDASSDGGRPDDASVVGPVGDAWHLVSRLNWCLLADRALDPAEVQLTIAELGAANGATLRRFMYDRAAELAADPYLATKSASFRLQIVALGPAWCEALLNEPALADFLESEAQAVNLEDLLQ